MIKHFIVDPTVGARGRALLAFCDAAMETNCMSIVSETDGGDGKPRAWLVRFIAGGEPSLTAEVVEVDGQLHVLCDGDFDIISMLDRLLDHTMPIEDADLEEVPETDLAEIEVTETAAELSTRLRSTRRTG